MNMEEDLERQILRELGAHNKSYIEYIRANYEKQALKVLLPYFNKLSRYFLSIDIRLCHGIYEAIAVHNIELKGIERYCDFSLLELSNLFRAILSGADIALYCNLGLTYQEFWNTIEELGERGISDKLVYSKIKEINKSNIHLRKY